ncbi:hypothetical protein FFLO_06798 [Filobasidium floriforme]|uniref:Uncharacterized protein n=1 Tax=Filobasidium floriforme TaxID=5210 RepID=A0A8K0JEP8_9TREE|nr:uncharacterized protein HD553DRAFT_334760 [Filobasidium floriforme]KAG7527577.1 hypothetical protein FFLO_06798 [Filobasidium floriforme]KAH8087107.1 hypothetical protein HD553DRAFT_334760 [Filobasidium floriforme]
MPSSDHPDVIAFDNGFPPDGLARFIRQTVDDLELKKTILRLPKKRSTDQQTVRDIYLECMKAVLRQVRINLEDIFGEDWSLQVRRQYMLNGTCTGADLGIKYKDTELYKAYVMLVDPPDPDVTGGLRMHYDLKKPADLNAAETATPAIAAPITPSDSPPADNLLTIDPDLNHPQSDNPIEIDGAHDTSHAVITDGPIADLSGDEDEEVDVAVDPVVTHWGYLFSPIQSKIGTNTTSTSTSTSVRKSRNRFDITLLAFDERIKKSDHEGPAQMQIVGGVVKVRYVSEEEIEGTVLAIPSEALGIKEESKTKSKKGIDDHPSTSVLRTPRGEPDLTDAEVTSRPPSFFTRRILQDLIAQIIWGLINVDAMSATRRPVYGMAVLNGWFVRMVVDGAERVVYLETMDPTSTSLNTSTSTSTDRKTNTNHQSSRPKSNSLKDLLTWFQYGRFRHHLATNSGVEKLYHWTIAGFRSFVLPATLTNDRKEDADSTATASAVETRTDLKRGAAEVSANEELEGTNRHKRTKAVYEEDSSQAREPAAPSTSYQAIKEKAESTVPDEPRRKVDTWLSKIDNNPEADQTPVAVDLDEPFNDDDEDDDNHNSSDSQEYSDYCTMVGQMEFLDQLGWTVEYCSIARISTTEGAESVAENPRPKLSRIAARTKVQENIAQRTSTAAHRTSYRDLRNRADLYSNGEAEGTSTAAHGLPIPAPGQVPSISSATAAASPSSGSTSAARSAQEEGRPPDGLIGLWSGASQVLADDVRIADCVLCLGRLARCVCSFSFCDSKHRISVYTLDSIVYVESSHDRLPAVSRLLRPA